MKGKVNIRKANCLETRKYESVQRTRKLAL